jgi:hypothetical protein
MTQQTKMSKTTVPGVGPFCVEFPDGEIVTTRSEERQRLLAAAPDLLAALKSAAMTAHYRGSRSCAGDFEKCPNCLEWHEVIVAAEGREAGR